MNYHRLQSSNIFDKTISDIYCGDSNHILDDIDNESIQLVVTSPPYNLGKEYEQDQRMTLDEYIDWLTPIITKLCNKISYRGSLCWQVGNFVQKGEVFPLDFFFYDIITKLGLKLRNRIIWRFNFGRHAENRFSGRYETILWFTKSDDYKFNLDPVRVPQLYPGKTHSASKGSKAGKPSGNPLGKNPSDYWEFSGESAFLTEPIWDIPNVKANHREKTSHPCQFPSELAERCVLAFSDAGDIILDPFSGAGTTVIAALKHARIGIGIDRDVQYVELAKDRISKFQRGELKLREAGKPVRKPKLGERVSTIPESWKLTKESEEKGSAVGTQKKKK